MELDPKKRVVLGLDIATQTGWAVGHPDGEPRYGSLTLPYEGDSAGKPMAFLRDWMGEMISTYNVELIAYEAPFVQHKREGHALKTVSLCGLVDLVGYDRSLPTYCIDISSNKKFFTGDGHASKVAMIRTCRLYGWTPKNDDEADALALWSYAVNWRYPASFRNRKLSADMGVKR
jgi:Holliday junction resolvasome RuvABC endonuclease subunit